MVNFALLKRIDKYIGKHRDNGEDVAVYTILEYYSWMVPIEYRSNIGIDSMH